MTKYCVGFIFDEGFHRVLLLRKKRPLWQLNLLNGCGGHVEGGEGFREAQARECLEETTLDIPQHLWIPVAVLTSPHASVKFYFTTANLEEARTVTDEPIEIVEMRLLHMSLTVPNLQWLVPLCKHFKSTCGGTRICAPVEIKESLVEYE